MVMPNSSLLSSYLTVVIIVSFLYDQTSVFLLSHRIRYNSTHYCAWMAWFKLIVAKCNQYNHKEVVVEIVKINWGQHIIIKVYLLLVRLIEGKCTNNFFLQPFFEIIIILWKDTILSIISRVVFVCNYTSYEFQFFLI